MQSTRPVIPHRPRSWTTDGSYSVVVRLLKLFKGRLDHGKQLVNPAIARRGTPSALQSSATVFD